jgi:hypothetical protein
MVMKKRVLFAVLLTLTACASSGTRSAGSASTGTQLTEAATAPLGDLNLVRAEIPAILSAAQKAPYAMPPDRACTALANEIQELDAVLGADLDTPPPSTDPGLVERGPTAAGQAVVGVVRGAAQDLVPFRSWVRKLSGAEKYSKEVAAAITAGTIRRGFLKGLGEAAGCAVPAAPRR